MSISGLAQKILPADSSNFTANRSRYSDIKEITVHHMAGFMSVEQLAEMWQNPTRDGSSHYGVNGNDIACYVSEGDIAWTNGDWEANCRAVTIEVANSAGEPTWTISDESLETVARLIADIAKRNNLGQLIPLINLTMHKQYSATACPGPYLQGKFEYLAKRANEINMQQEQPEDELSALTRLLSNLESAVNAIKDYVAQLTKEYLNNI